MKYKFLLLVSLIILIVPVIASAQATDTIAVKTDSIPKPAIDTTVKAAVDTAVKVNADTAMVATPMNCYKQWLDVFNELHTKPLTDGVHEVVIAFKTKQSCHCYMGKVEVAGGKIKAPVYVQTEGGDYKTFVALGKKLDPDFIADQGDGIWSVTNGMSVLFQTTEQEYGRVFFYKFLNKNKKMNKEAPSPSELLQ